MLQAALTAVKSSKGYDSQIIAETKSQIELHGLFYTLILIDSCQTTNSL
jgi:hypothetical protein